jgi:hypothetical protein
VAGSSPDNDGTGRYCQTARVRQARPKGVTRVNQRLKLRNVSTGSNLVDVGRFAVRGSYEADGPTPKPYESVGEEAMLKACGVGVAMLPGYSWAPTRSIESVMNVGTVVAYTVSSAAGLGVGRVRCRPGRQAGRRPRSSPSMREACTWRRGPASQQRGGWNAWSRW